MRTKKKKKLAFLTLRTWNTFKIRQSCDIGILWAGFAAADIIIIQIRFS